MPNVKPRYIGDGNGEKPRDFSAALREKLRSFYPDKNVDSDQEWVTPADAFVSEVLSEASWAVSELYFLKMDRSNSEIRAEHKDLLVTLQQASKKLRTISTDYDRLMPVHADPEGCVEKLDDMISCVKATEPRIAQLPKTLKPDQKKHSIAVEMALRVLRVLKDSGIPPNATGDSYFGYTSLAVQILKSIGDDIGLELAPLTWRDIIVEAKKQAKDL